MRRGYTLVMNAQQSRYPMSAVAGLYDVAEQSLHQFGQCTMSGQPKVLLTLGRARYCDIKLTDPTVSLVHCDIMLGEDGTCLIQDADSTNGLFANDIRVEKVMLVPGMWLFLGRTELVAVGSDGSIPITATTNSSFLHKAHDYYGSDRKAAERVGKSPATIGRARKRRQDRNRR